MRIFLLWSIVAVLAISAPRARMILYGPEDGVIIRKCDFKPLTMEKVLKARDPRTGKISRVVIKVSYRKGLSGAKFEQVRELMLRGYDIQVEYFAPHKNIRTGKYSGPPYIFEYKDYSGRTIMTDQGEYEFRNLARRLPVPTT